MIESAFRPPAVCRECRDCEHCEVIHWAFSDAEGSYCPAYEPELVDSLAAE